MTLDELKIVLGLDSSGMKKGAKEAENAISGLMSKLSALSAAFTAAMSIGAAWQQYISQADAMGKLADALDVDISKMHAWGEATARAGGSVEAFQGSLQSLTAQLARQSTMGTSRAAKLLEGAGIDAGELGRQRDAFAVMMDLAEKAETMGKQEFFGLGRALGLDTGTIMLLQQGREALKKQIQLQKEFGVYTKEDARVTADFNDRMADLGQVFRSVSSIIFRLIIPPMTRFIEVFNKALAFLRKNERFVQIFFITIATIITTLLIPAFIKLAAAMLANPLTWFVAGVAALALALDDLFGWMEGKDAAWGEYWANIFGTEDPKEAKKKFDELKQGAVDLFNAMSENLPTINEMWEGMIKAVKMLEKAMGVLRSPLENLIKVFESVGNGWEMLKDVISKGIEFLYDKFLQLADVVGKALNPWAQRGQALTGNATTGDTGAALNTYGMEADGGIFTEPTRAIIGEAGAEAVIPFSPGKRNRGLELLSRIAGAFGVGEKEASPIINVDNDSKEQKTPIVDFAFPKFEMPKIEMPNFALPKIEMPEIQAAQALPMGGATTNNNINTDTRVNVGTVNINAENGADAANQFMTGIENRAQRWTAAANAAY